MVLTEGRTLYALDFHIKLHHISAFLYRRQQAELAYLKYRLYLQEAKITTESKRELQ